MSSDWWAKRLGQQPAQYTPPPVQQPSYPQGPSQQPQLPPMGHQGGDSYPQVTKDNFAQVAGLWKGGKATKTETSACPNCGGDHYFSQTNTNPLAGGAGGAGARLATPNGMATTSPRCFDCGYSTARPLQTGSM